MSRITPAPLLPAPSAPPIVAATGRRRRLAIFLLTFAAIPLFPSVSHADAASAAASPASETAEGLPPLVRLFKQANLAYESGEFEQARELYRQILAVVPGNATVHYNLGNSHARLDDPARAVLHYERAIRLNPRLRDARQNLIRIAPPSPGPEVNPLSLPFRWMLGLFSVNEWLSLFFVLFLTTSIFGVAWALDSRRAPWWKGLTLTAILSLLIVGSFAVTAVALHLRVEGVVLVDKAMARGGPGENYLEAMELPAGARIGLVGEPHGGWIKFRAPDGAVAWIRTAEIEKIE